ncbi:hypothetical protein Hanom_Chr04g00383731 [Helianthus anomalus]
MVYFSVYVFTYCIQLNRMNTSNLIRINSPFCFLWFHLNYFSKTAECTFWVSLNQTC